MRLLGIDVVSLLILPRLDCALIFWLHGYVLSRCFLGHGRRGLVVDPASFSCSGVDLSTDWGGGAFGSADACTPAPETKAPRHGGA